MGRNNSSLQQITLEYQTVASFWVGVSSENHGVLDFGWCNVLILRLKYQFALKSIAHACKNVNL